MSMTEPSNKRLILAWLLMMGLTILSLWSAQLSDGTQWNPLPLWGVGLVLVTAGCKAQQILMVYLNLRQSSAGWQGSFICVLVGTLLLVFCGYIFAPLD